jgi:60 kDa SS-A/Ro ribonucleoprotein
MARQNRWERHLSRTQPEARLPQLAPELELRRAVLACLLWESQFHENRIEIGARIRELVPKVPAEKVAALALEARGKMKLRHAPLVLVREMARHAMHRNHVAGTLTDVIQRADDLTEFVAIYWKDGRAPLAAQVKKGLAGAFLKLDAYELRKHHRDGPVQLRDVLVLAHARPADRAQAEVWKLLLRGELTAPATQEVASRSAGDRRAQVQEAGKRETWERLLHEQRMGARSLLRNLGAMHAAGVDAQLVLSALRSMNPARVSPVRFLAAARHAPRWKEALELAMLRCVAGEEKLAGTSIVLVDVSGSMTAPLADVGGMRRIDAACGLAVCLRENCEKVRVFSFSDSLVEVARRRGFALRDAIENSQPHSGSRLGDALAEIERTRHYDRLVVITDEPVRDRLPAPKGKAYMINLASRTHGVGYSHWTHIDGWSDSVVDYIRMLEQTG